MRLFGRRIALLIVSILTLAGCAAPRADLSDRQMQSTVDAAQATIDVMRAEGAATAQSWMTEAAPAPTNAADAAGTAVPYGAISGTLSYPSEQIPALRLVAFNVSGDAFVALEVAAGSGDFRMDYVPPGSYQLVAYPLEWQGDVPIAGGFTQAVPCGLQASCTDHSLMVFEVRAGEETAGIDPADWYAPAGTFLSDPTR